jgi:hypothetical protein
MDAMQAQDLNMVLWAVGLRLKRSTLKKIEDSFNKGVILRTHLMRPTWHLVSFDDIYWILDLTAPRLINALKFRDKELGLNQEIFKKSNSIIENLFSKQKFVTREELSEKYSAENIKTNENRLSHLLYHAELCGLICSGELKKGKQTYAMLSERVPNRKKKTKDEALAELAKRYFTSHGPATLKDFIWWSGLTATDASKGLNAVRKNFDLENINSETYYFSALKNNYKPDGSLFILPAYDEFIISYKDRSSSITQEDFRKAISNNGMFYPVIIENGIVIGIWKRSISKDKIVIEPKFFHESNSETQKSIETKCAEFELFMGKKVEFSVK